MPIKEIARISMPKSRRLLPGLRLQAPAGCHHEPVRTTRDLEHQYDRRCRARLGVHEDPRTRGIRERRRHSRAVAADLSFVQGVRRLRAIEPLRDCAAPSTTRPRVFWRRFSSRRLHGCGRPDEEIFGLPRKYGDFDLVTAIFIANQGNVGHLHFDGDQREVFLHQVYGRKRVVLFQPASAIHLRTLDGPYTRPSLVRTVSRAHEPRREAFAGRSRRRLSHRSRAGRDHLHSDADVASPRIRRRCDVVGYPIRTDSSRADSSRSTTSIGIRTSRTLLRGWSAPTMRLLRSIRSSRISRRRTRNRFRHEAEGSRHADTVQRVVHSISGPRRPPKALPTGAGGGTDLAHRGREGHEGRAQIRGSRRSSLGPVPLGRLRPGRSTSSRTVSGRAGIRRRSSGRWFPTGLESPTSIS